MVRKQGTINIRFPSYTRSKPSLMKKMRCCERLKVLQVDNLIFKHLVNTLTGCSNPPLGKMNLNWLGLCIYRDSASFFSMPDRASRTFVLAPWALLKLAPPSTFLQLRGDPTVGQLIPAVWLSVKAHVLWCQVNAKRFRPWPCSTVSRKIFISAQFIGWSFVHACSTMAEISTWYFTHESLCS